MGAVAYCYEDWVKSLVASKITITNEDTNYPETNCQDEQIALTTRTTAKASIKIQLDLGSAKQPKFFFIGNHNFSGGTFDINSYTDSDFVTGKATIEDDKAVRLLDVFHYESSAPTARQYWEFDLTNVTSSSDSYFEFGRIMLYSDYTSITDNPDKITSRNYGFGNIINKTEYGIRYAHRKTEKIEAFELSWNARSSTTLATELRTLYETVYGDAYPFVFIPDVSGTACYYVYLEEPNLWYSELFGIGSDAISGDVRLKLIEAVRGKV